MGRRALALIGRGRTGGAVAGSLAAALHSQAALVVTGVLSARALGPEYRGYLALVVFLPAVLAQVAPLGLPQAVTYFTARNDRATYGIVRTVFPVAVVQVGVASLVHLALLPLFFHDAPRAVWSAALLGLLATPASSAQNYGLAVLQGQRRFVAFNSLRVVPVSVYALGVLSLFLLGAATLQAVALAWVAAQVAAVSLTWYVASRGIERGRYPHPAVREMTRFGLGGFLGSTSPVETFRLDQALIGLFLTPAALGLYVVGLSFTNLPRFVSQSIGMVAYPRIAAEADPFEARRALWRFTWLTVGACAAVAGVLWPAAGFLVPFFFGQEFSGSVTLTRLLLVGSLFWATRRVLSDGTRGLHQPRLGSIAEVISWVVLAPALVTLMPAWGVEGVAVALVIASASSMAAMLVLTVSTSERVAPRAPTAAEGLTLARTD